MSLKASVKSTFLSALVLSACNLCLFGDEVVLLTKDLTDGRLVGKRKPIPEAEMAAREKWRANHPLKSGSYVVSDTEYFVEWIPTGESTLKVWSRNARAGGAPDSRSNIYPFGRKGCQLLDVHFDKQSGIGVIVYWNLGLIWADVVCVDPDQKVRVLTDTRGPPVGTEYDKKLIATGVKTDPESKELKLSTEYDGGERREFRLVNGKWNLEKPLEKEDKK